jgi:hypothetical protein
MRQLTIAAATVAIAALITAAPAMAERHGGGPMKQNGMCWKASKGQEAGTWGIWEACPKPASAPAATAKRTRNRA